MTRLTLIRIKVALKWAPHNMVGHPVMALLHCFGLRSLGNWVHDVTIPWKDESP